MGGKIGNTELTRYPKSLPQGAHITREGQFCFRISNPFEVSVSDDARTGSIRIPDAFVLLYCVVRIRGSQEDHCINSRC
jgi:hypothetical protein